MATPGGGGGGRLRVPPGDGDPSGGGGDGRVRQRLFYEGGDEEQCSIVIDSEQLPLLQPAMPPPAESQRAWSTTGNTSSENLLSHYVSDGGQESEVWELFIQFDGAKFVQKSMERLDVRYLNLLSIMEKEGYGLCDSMYYVKDEGEALEGLHLVDSQVKVDEMIRKYDSSKQLVLTVMRDKRKQHLVVSPMKSKEAGEDRPIPYQVQTQDSVCYQPLHTEENPFPEVDENPFPEEEDDGEASDDSYSWLNEVQYDPVYAEEKRRKEEEELKATMAEMKRKREDPMLQYEGETDVEDIFVNDDEWFEEIPPEQPMKKKVKRPGPTLRSHSQVVIPDIPDWAPSDDEEEVGFLKEEDDDAFEPLSFVLPKGRKSRAKKQGLV